MALYLGIDGGGSGCRAVAADAAGVVVGSGRAGSANIVTDPEGARASIVAAATEALAGAAPQTAHAVLGLAGANLTDFVAPLVARLPFASSRVVSDAVIAARGALGLADGITATLGTGSVFACQRAGTVTVIGGWGFVLGDEASGAWMGRALLARALRARDGLELPSPLLTEVTGEVRGAEALVAFARDATPADFARYAPRVVAAAEAPGGDGGAEAILAEADLWVLRSIARFQTGGLPLCFLGGLGPVFARRLAPHFPGLIRAAQGTALDGALAMALAERSVADV